MHIDMRAAYSDMQITRKRDVYREVFKVATTRTHMDMTRPPGPPTQMTPYQPLQESLCGQTAYGNAYRHWRACRGPSCFPSPCGPSTTARPSHCTCTTPLMPVLQMRSNGAAHAGNAHAYVCTRVQVHHGSVVDGRRATRGQERRRHSRRRRRKRTRPQPSSRRPGPRCPRQPGGSGHVAAAPVPSLAHTPCLSGRSCPHSAPPRRCWGYWPRAPPPPPPPRVPP